MEGYIHPIRKQPATGVHDIPLATLLLLEIESVRELFVSIDVCMLKAQRLDRMRTDLADLLDISKDHIVINAIHSHSCPSGLEGTSSMGIPITPGYNDMVTGLVVQAATKLTDKLVEAEPQLLIQRVHGWYSNRNDPSAPFDDEALILRFVAADGVVAGAMLNFNCRATVVGPSNRLLTTDVQGGVRNELAEWIGCVPYIFTGASGDLGNRQFRRGSDFAELRRVSNGIAGEIIKGIFTPIELSAPVVHSFLYHVAYNNEQFYPQYQKQLDAVHRVLANNPTLDEKKLADTEKEMLEQQLTRHEVDFTVQMTTIDFGKLVFVTFPGELASELGTYIKKSFAGTDKHPTIIGYANDYQGYFVAAHTYGKTNYESYVTKMPKGWTEEMLTTYREQL